MDRKRTHAGLSVRDVKKVIKIALIESHETGWMHPWYSPRYPAQQYNLWENDDVEGRSLGRTWGEMHGHRIGRG